MRYDAKFVIVAAARMGSTRLVLRQYMGRCGERPFCSVFDKYFQVKLMGDICTQNIGEIIAVNEGSQPAMESTNMDNDHTESETNLGRRTVAD